VVAILYRQMRNRAVVVVPVILGINWHCLADRVRNQMFVIAFGEIRWWRSKGRALHEDGSGEGLRRRASSLQSPLSADVWSRMSDDLGAPPFLTYMNA
jgi:hypothetical protein